jgi:hypothetical protein
MIKNLEEDFPKIRYFYGGLESYDASLVPEYRSLCGEDGIFTLTIGYPGMQMWQAYFEGNLQSAVYAWYDHPEIFEEWAELAHNQLISHAEILLSLKPDVLLLGGSGTLTLACPEIRHAHHQQDLPHGKRRRSFDQAPLLRKKHGLSRNARGNRP